MPTKQKNKVNSRNSPSSAIVLPPVQKNHIASTSRPSSEILVKKNKNKSSASKASKANTNVNRPDANKFPTEYDRNRVLQPSWLVQTPYGVGLVQASRLVEISNSSNKQTMPHKPCFQHKYHIRLLPSNSNSSNNNKVNNINTDMITTEPSSPRRLITFDNFPSIEPQIGSEVVLTCFNNYFGTSTPQRGRVVHLRPSQRQAVVRLVSWRLLRETTTTSKQQQKQQHRPSISFVTCYVNYQSIQVVAPKPLSEMSAYETFLYVHERQHLAYAQYLARNYGPSLQLYESAISAMKSLLNSNSSNGRNQAVPAVRGNLILTQIRCCNQAAACCLHVRNYQGVISHSVNALKLLCALEAKGKTGGGDGSQRQQLERLSGEIRVFGIGRVKALQLLTLALMHFHQWESAKDLLMQAHKIVVKYTGSAGTGLAQQKQSSTSTKPPSSSSLFLHYERRRAQLLRVDKALLRLYAKVEKSRAGRVGQIPTDRSIVVENKNTSSEHGDYDDDCAVSALSDGSASSLSEHEEEDDENLKVADWLDDDEERDMEAEWKPISMVVGSLDALLLPHQRTPTETTFSVATFATSTSSEVTPHHPVAAGTADAVATVATNTTRANEVTPPSAATTTVPEDEGKQQRGSKEWSLSLDDADCFVSTPTASTSSEVIVVPPSSSSSSSAPVVAERREDQATRIQSAYRGSVWRRGYNRKRQSAMYLQKLARGQEARRMVEQERERSRLQQQELAAKQASAATKLQSVQRGVFQRQAYRHKLDEAQRVAHNHRNKATLLVQNNWRVYHAQSNFQKQRQAALLLQSGGRRVIACQQVEERKQGRIAAACVVLQRLARRDHARQLLQNHKKSARLIQSTQRCSAQRKKYLVVLKSTVRVQSLARGHLTRHDLQSRQKSSTMIQARVRGTVECQSYRLKREAAIHLQTALRCLSQQKKYLQLLGAVVVLQKWARARLSRLRYLKSKEAANAAATRIQSYRRSSVLRKDFQQKRLVTASCIVQSAQRCSAQRTKYLVLLKSTVRVQSLARGRLTRHDMQTRQNSSTVIQARMRGTVERQSYRLKREAAIHLQTALRCSSPQKKYLQLLGAVVVLQKWARARLSRLRYLKSKEAANAAATKIQSYRRSSVLRKDFQQKRLVKASCIVQSAQRCSAQRTKYLVLLKSTVRVQSLARGRLTRHDLQTHKKSASMIQARVRGTVECQSYRLKREAAIHLQTALRCSSQQKKYLQLLGAVVVLQKWARARLSRLRYLKSKEAANAAATRIQSYRRSSVLRKDFQQKRLVKASCIVQSAQRCSAQRKQYLLLLKSIVRIQSLARGCQARRLTEELREDVLVRLKPIPVQIGEIDEAKAMSERQRLALENEAKENAAVVCTDTETASSTPKADPIQPGTEEMARPFTAALKTTLAAEEEAKVPLTSRVQPSKPSALKILSIIPERGDEDATSQVSEAASAVDPQCDTSSVRSETSGVASLNSCKFSVVSAPAYVRSGAGDIRDRSGRFTAPRKAFVDPATLRMLQKRNHNESTAREQTYASPSMSPLATPTSTSCLSSSDTLVDDDASAMSEDASFATAMSGAFFDAASHQSDDHSASDVGSINSGYSKYSTVSAPAFVRSEVGTVRDSFGNVVPTRKVFVDATTLKKLQKRSRPSATGRHRHRQSGSQRKPFLAPHLMDELTEASASSLQQGFPPVYEEPPDDQWRDEIKVFAPSTKKKTSSHTDNKSSGRRLGVTAQDDRSIGKGSSRRVSFAQDVVLSEDFTSSRVQSDSGNATADSTEHTPRRRAWYQTQEFRAGFSTIVASGATVGTMIAAKILSKKR